MQLKMNGIKSEEMQPCETQSLFLCVSVYLKIQALCQPSIEMCLILRKDWSILNCLRKREALFFCCPKVLVKCISMVDKYNKSYKILRYVYFEL